MAEAVWEVLDSVAAGGALWLSVILVLALLGEMGLPFTCPIIESLLVFTGFQLVHGALLVAVLPFLAVAYAGRLIGSTSAYKLSERVGGRFMQRFGPRLHVTPERVMMLKERLSNVLVPTIFLARFTPGLTVLTSFVCGMSRVGRRPFLRAVTGQLLAWEVAFLLAGALGGLASRSIDPSSYPKAIAFIIGISLSIGAVGGYLVFHKARRYPHSGNYG
ncbi:MAG: hypothetical protein IMY84_00695 [Chloroflexi bacterium]|nr:hypothetical protein [Chloroflexota bacterium]